MRKININLEGYSEIINPNILKRVANRNHTMAKMPYYPKTNEPTKLYEEDLVEGRFKELSDSYSNTFDTAKDKINPMMVMMNAGGNGMKIMGMEKPKRVQLCRLVEKIAREQFNLDKDEILFDLEIVDVGGCGLPEEMDIEKEVTEDFEQTNNLDVLKKRTINALSQGAALKSHYIFHLYRDEFEELCPGVTEIYQKALIANDMIYFMLDDDDLNGQLADGDDSSNAGYCKLNFDGDIPVIEAKAISAPILIHEVSKAIISFLSIPGIQNMDQDTIDETDFVMAELWDIRFGPTIWTEFHGCIDVDDYDIKKLIIMGLFKLNSSEFIGFMSDVHNNNEKARKEVKYMAKDIRNKIMDYQFDQDLPDIDLSELGL
jgi:hypothetical protein